jgi:hypothetical protein
MFEDLIQETEKARNFKRLFKKCPTCKYNAEEEIEEAKIETLKQCQTIADEREKELKEIFDDFINTEIGYGGVQTKNFERLKQKLFKQQLNPAQTKE